MTEKLTPATDEEIAAFIAECQEWAAVPSQCVWPLRLILRLQSHPQGDSK